MGKAKPIVRSPGQIKPMLDGDWQLDEPQQQHTPYHKVGAEAQHAPKTLGGVALAALNESIERKSALRSARIAQAICLVSQFGLWYALAATLQLSHAFEGDPEAQGYWEVGADPFVGSAVVLVPLSSLAVVVLLRFQYAEMRLKKVLEWRQGHSLFNFWKSSLPYYFLAEVLMHVPQPYYNMNVDTLAYKTLVCLMFVRMYTVFRPFVTFYKEVFMSGKHNQSSHKVSAALHIMFYRHTYSILCVSAVVVIVCCSIVVLLFERHNPSSTPQQSFNRLPNVFWFSFITSISIGYGDMFPSSGGGRLATVFLGLAMTVFIAIFGGVITNKLAPTREMTDLLDEEAKSTAILERNRCAASLIQAAWHTYKRNPNGKNLYKTAKSFRLSCMEMKTAEAAQDPVVEEKLTALIGRMETLENTLLGMKHDMLDLQRLMADVLQANETMMARYMHAKRNSTISPQAAAP